MKKSTEGPLGSRFASQGAARHVPGGLCCLLLLLSLVIGGPKVWAAWPKVVPSQDGTPISYEASGAKEPTLVFVHGWSCDARYRRAQAAYFSKRHRVVTLDLAAHGHSGMGRSRYTMEFFASIPSKT